MVWIILIVGIAMVVGLLVMRSGPVAQLYRDPQHEVVSAVMRQCIASIILKLPFPEIEKRIRTRYQLLSDEAHSAINTMQAAQAGPLGFALTPAEEKKLFVSLMIREILYERGLIEKPPEFELDLDKIAINIRKKHGDLVAIAQIYDSELMEYFKAVRTLPPEMLQRTADGLEP